MEANALYNSLTSHDRDDALAMQYLIPGWKYDCKKPGIGKIKGEGQSMFIKKYGDPK